jgi:hypothetical protein
VYHVAHFLVRLSRVGSSAGGPIRRCATALASLEPSLRGSRATALRHIYSLFCRYLVWSVAGFFCLVFWVILPFFIFYAENLYTDQRQ